MSLLKVLNYLHKKMGKGFSVCLYRLPLKCHDIDYLDVSGNRLLLRPMS